MVFPASRKISGTKGSNDKQPKMLFCSDRVRSEIRTCVSDFDCKACEHPELPAESGLYVSTSFRNTKHPVGLLDRCSKGTKLINMLMFVIFILMLKRTETIQLECGR